MKSIANLHTRLTLPPLKKVKLWAGICGGHYDVIVFFNKKPRKTEESGYTTSGKEIDLLAEDKSGNIFLSMYLPNFHFYFPGMEELKPRHSEIDPSDLFRIDLDLPLTNGELYGIDFSADGWNR